MNKGEYMLQVLLKGATYHCSHCHKTYHYRGDPTGCTGADCCHGLDHLLTEKELEQEYQKIKKTMRIDEKN